MKNSLLDLNNHLFSQLERLSDEELSAEALQQEIGRAKAVTDVAGAVIHNAALVLKAHEMAEISGKYSTLPKMLGIEA